jgi:hypothetical protein
VELHVKVYLYKHYNLCNFIVKYYYLFFSNPDVLVKSAKEGVERVKKGGYAYILESTSNEYVRERDCDLIQIGGLLDNKGYGFGTPSGSMWYN